MLSRKAPSTDRRGFSIGINQRLAEGRSRRAGNESDTFSPFRGGLTLIGSGSGYHGDAPEVGMERTAESAMGWSRSCLRVSCSLGVMAA